MAQDPASPDEPELTLPPIAGVGRRLVAFAADAVLLGLVGQILGRAFMSLWFEIGPYGRFVGLMLVLPYFGLLNARTGNGQTLGKRLMRIAVRDERNQMIGSGRSLVRASILVLPLLLNGWALPALEVPVLAWLAATVVFGLGGALLYTLSFNRRAWQGIHDLAVGSYVVRLAGAPVGPYPKTRRIHLRVSAVIVVVAAAVSGLGNLAGGRLFGRTGLGSVLELYQILRADDRLFSVNVTASTTVTTGAPTIHALNVRLWQKGNPSYEDRIQTIYEIGKLALASDDIDSYDWLSVSVSSKYDLGIATGHLTLGDNEPIEVWRAR
jgi:uncharacterized RDD family membrane protein YckC